MMNIKFRAEQVPGKGWTVVKVTGSKHAGRAIEKVEGYCDTYTMHQAQIAAAALSRDFARHANSKG